MANVRTVLTFEAEYKSFQAGVKAVNSEIGTLKSELKAVDADIKANGQNAENTAKKHEILTQLLEKEKEKTALYKAEIESLNKKQDEAKTSLEQRKNALEQSKTALEALEKAENSDKTAIEAARKAVEEQAKALGSAQSEYDKTEQKLNTVEKAFYATTAETTNLTKQIKDNEASLSAWTRAAEKMEKAGNAIESTGKTLTKTVTAPIVAVGTAAGAAWNELDAAYDAIAAGTGATGEALKGIQESFNEVYGSFPADSEEVATAIADLNTRFGFTDDALEAATVDFLKFAQVNGSDVSSSIALVSRAMGDAGVSADEYGSVLDSLTAASQASGITVDALAESLTSYGAPMRNLGFTMEESIALFAQWEKAGVNTSVAFSGLKSAISGWGKEGKDAAAEFQKTLDAIATAPSIADATALAIDAFGSKAGPDLADAIQGGRFSIEEMMATVEKAGGQVDASFGEMEDPADRLTTTLNSLKLAGSDLASAAMESLAPVLEEIADLCKQFSEWFGGVSDDTKEIIIKIGLIAAAVGPVLVGIGKLITACSSISKLFGSLSAGGGLFAKIGAAVGGISAPVLAVVAVVAALVGVFVTLWNTSDSFRQSITNTIDKVKASFGGLVDKVKKFLEDNKPIFDQIWKTIQDCWSWLCTTLEPWITWFVESVGGVISGILDSLGHLLDFLTAVFSGDWQGAWDAICNIFSTIWNTISTLLSSFITLAWEKISEFFGDIWEKLTSWLSETFVKIKEWFGELPTKIKEWLGKVIEKVSAWKDEMILKFNTTCSEVFEKIKEWFASLPQRFSEWLNGVVQKIVQWGSDMKTEAEKAVTDTVNKIVEWFKELPEKVVSIGSDIITGIWNGITGSVSWLWEKVSGFCGELVDKFKGFLGIHSPSKVFSQAASYIPAGISEGLKKGASTVDKTMASLTDGMLGQFEGRLGTIPVNFGVNLAGLSAMPEMLKSVAENASVNPSISYQAYTRQEQIIEVQPRVILDGREIMTCVKERVAVSNRGMALAGRR